MAKIILENYSSEKFCVVIKLKCKVLFYFIIHKKEIENLYVVWVWDYMMTTIKLVYILIYDAITPKYNFIVYSLYIYIFTWK